MAAAANGHHANGHDSRRRRVLILGAAGRDYHTFLTRFRGDDAVEVVGFTHAQIPHIEAAAFPPELAGAARYPNGLPIWPQDDLERVIKENKVDTAVMAYSDVSFDTLNDLGARARSAGADFVLLGARAGMLRSTKPVVAVTAVRTGCGKSQVCALVVDAARKAGKKVVLVRHPMPYGALAEQAVQRFEVLGDLDKHKTTVEEREEYEQHLRNGVVVYAGVDYAAILREAEREADVVLWDGGNNDTPFFAPDLWLCVADALRPGHETRFYPGDCNFRCADGIVINKANAAPEGAIAALRAEAARLNPRAAVWVTASEVTVDRPELVAGKRVVCVDDGPTITHGGLATGAGVAAAEKYGAASVLDPRPRFVGALKKTLETYPHIGPCVPALGYSKQQVADLAATLEACGTPGADNGAAAEAVLIGTPHDLTAVLEVKLPVVRVAYAVRELAVGEEEGDGGEGGKKETLAARLARFMAEEEAKVVA